jgi:hypothetical protein
VSSASGLGEPDPDELARAFGRPVPSYEIEPIDPDVRIHSVTGGVYRVRAGDDSAVLKVVRHGVDADPGGLWVSGAHPGHRNYWKREWLAFDTGLLDGLPGRLRAPRTLLTTEHSDGECWIWMEDVAGRHGPDLQLEDYEVIARDLATTQGAYAAGTTALPDQDWLSRDWLRGWVEVAGRHVDVIADGDVWLDERIGSLVPLRKRALDVWRERERLLAIVDEAPRTVVHLDFWPTNLFVADGEPTVAIDWSQVGIGGLAQDIDQIVLDPLWMQVLPDVDPRMLERHVVHAYTAGLQEAGCDVAIADVHRWYAAAGSVHYTPMLGFQAAAVADADAVAFQERRWGRTFGQITATRGAALQRAIELGEQVLA